MKKIAPILLFALIQNCLHAQTYVAPKVQINTKLKQYKVHKVKVYEEFEENYYKVQERPVRKRDLASQKLKKKRSPSSESKEPEKVQPWKWQE